VSKCRNAHWPLMPPWRSKSLPTSAQPAVDKFNCNRRRQPTLLKNVPKHYHSASHVRKPHLSARFDPTVSAMANTAAVASRLLRVRSALSRAWHLSPPEMCIVMQSSMPPSYRTSSSQVTARSLGAGPLSFSDDWRASLRRGTWDDPVPIASSVGAHERVVMCAGPVAHPHPARYITVQTGRPMACPSCSQVFMLADADDCRVSVSSN
jgi:uncharacterized Zn-finger protein